MSKKLPWFHFYATDWISDETVRLMSSRQKGWYIDLLAHDWQEEGIPDDIERCKHLTSFWADCDLEKSYARASVEHHAQTVEHDWASEISREFQFVFEMFADAQGNARRSHPRLFKQRANASSASEHARKAANARWSKRHTRASSEHQSSNNRAYARALPEQCESESESESEKDSSSCSQISTTVENNTPAFRAREAPAATAKKAGANPLPSAVELSLQPLLDELAEIYRKAGAPIPEKHRHIAAQLLAAIPPEKRDRVPNYCKWALVSGKWPSPAKTKSLLNVLRDGDWDVELTQRILPSVQNETSRERVFREATQRYLRSKGVAC